MAEKKSPLHAPPALPWKKGKGDVYSAFSLTVDICEDEFGRVWSGHGFEAPEDEETAHALKNAGVPQIAYALLTEAMRREAYALLLAQMSRSPGFLAEYVSSDDETKRALELELGQGAQKVMTETLLKMGPGVGREILTMLESL